MPRAAASRASTNKEGDSICFETWLMGNQAWLSPHRQRRKIVNDVPLTMS
jgi:hypothetical protein